MRYQINANEGIRYMKIQYNPAPAVTVRLTSVIRPEEPDKKRSIYRINGSNNAPITAPVYQLAIFQYYIIVISIHNINRFEN
jgi:hypothetical protein